MRVPRSGSTCLIRDSLLPSPLSRDPCRSCRGLIYYVHSACALLLCVCDSSPQGLACKRSGKHSTVFKVLACGVRQASCACTPQRRPTVLVGAHASANCHLTKPRHIVHRTRRLRQKRCKRFSRMWCPQVQRQQHREAGRATGALQIPLWLGLSVVLPCRPGGTAVHLCAHALLTSRDASSTLWPIGPCIPGRFPLRSLSACAIC